MKDKQGNELRQPETVARLIGGATHNAAAFIAFAWIVVAAPDGWKCFGCETFNTSVCFKDFNHD